MALTDPITSQPTAQGTQYQYNGLSYNSMGQAVTAKNNLTSAANYPPQGAFIPTPYNQNGILSNSNSSTSASPQSYAVVTSQPATQNYQNIQSQYQNTIAPAAATSAATNAATTQAQASTPVVAGYNVTTSPTGNSGETTITQNGQTYYMTPQQPAATANDVISAINGTSSTNATTTGAGGLTNYAPAVPDAGAEATAATGINPQTETTNYETAVQSTDDEISNAANSFSQIIQNLSSGVIPFTPAQQSLIDATNQAFNQMTTNANLKAAALSSETGGVSNKVNAMGGELLNINSDQAAAIAKMEVGFQTENYQEKYQTVTAAYSAYKDAETAKMDSIQKIHDSVMATYNSALGAAQKQFDESMQVSNFNLTASKDLNDEAYQNGMLSETQYKDNQDVINQRVTESIDAYNAGLIPGGTFNPSTGTFTASDGTQGTSPSSLPGYTTTANGLGIVQHPNGDTFYVGSDGTLTKMSAGAASTFIESSNSANTISQMQVLYNKIGSGNDLGANIAQYDSLQNSLPPGDQKIVPNVNSFTGGIFAPTSSGNAQFVSAYNIFNTRISGAMPSAIPPIYGQRFTDIQSATTWAQQTGNTDYIVQLHNQGLSDDQILQKLNGS